MGPTPPSTGAKPPGFPVDGTPNPTGNVYLDSLLWLTPKNPFKVVSGRTKITFAFGNAGTYDLLPDPDTEPSIQTTTWNAGHGIAGQITLLNGDRYRVGPTQGEQGAVSLALQLWASVAKIDFVQKPSGKVLDADLKFVVVTNDQMLAYDKGDTSEGWDYPFAEMPNDSTKPSDAKKKGFAVFNNGFSEWSQSSLMPGSIGFADIVHEIGHLLGLDHPWYEGGKNEPAIPGARNDSAKGDNHLCQGIFTTMCYNYGWDGEYGTGQSELNDEFGSQIGPMAFDIAAAQVLYGANMSTHKGKDTYVLPTENKEGTGWMCLWDAGGIDTIEAPDSAGDSTIDLRAATLAKDDRHAGGYVSWVHGIAGGFTIAHGVIIENARGGRGDDIINGNEAGNSLAGGIGDDTIHGFEGNDTLSGGDGCDWLDGGAGSDILKGGDGNDTLVGALGTADTLTGGSGDDLFRFDCRGLGSGSCLVQDEITDFQSGHDHLDFSRSGYRFSYAGHSAFGGTAGELILTACSGSSLLMGDIDGDGTADFQIRLDHVTSLATSDLILK